MKGLSKSSSRQGLITSPVSEQWASETRNTALCWHMCALTQVSGPRWSKKFVNITLCLAASWTKCIRKFIFYLFIYCLYSLCSLPRQHPTAHKLIRVWKNNKSPNILLGGCSSRLCSLTQFPEILVELIGCETTIRSLTHRAQPPPPPGEFNISTCISETTMAYGPIHATFATMALLSA